MDYRPRAGDDNDEQQHDNSAIKASLRSLDSCRVDHGVSLESTCAGQEAWRREFIGVQERPHGPMVRTIDETPPRRMCRDGLVCLAMVLVRRPLNLSRVVRKWG